MTVFIRRYNHSFNLIVFSLLFCVYLYDVLALLGLGFIDEFFVLYLYAIWLLHGSPNREFKAFICLALFYLIYGIMQRTNVLPAIISDFFVEIKPFVAYYTASSLMIELSDSERKKIRHICLILALLLLPVGINYLLGGNWMLTMPGHPSRFASIYQILGLVYLAFSDQTNANYRISTFIMAGSLFSERSKAYGFFVIVLLILLYKDTFLKRKLLSFKIIIIICIALLVVLFVAKEKIYFYFIVGTDNTEAMFARPALYATGWEILKNNPLLGSGLGSFATYFSGVYYSPIYFQYGLDSIHGLSPDNYDFVSDTFYPVLAQFGIVGIFFFFLFWKRRFVYVQHKTTEQKKVFLLLLLMTIMLTIESVADNTFIQNRGVFIMMLMGIALSDNNYSRIILKNNSHIL